jgi:hypothetical protein
VEGRRGFAQEVPGQQLPPEAFAGVERVQGGECGHGGFGGASGGHEGQGGHSGDRLLGHDFAHRGERARHVAKGCSGKRVDDGGVVGGELAIWMSSEDDDARLGAWDADGPALDARPCGLDVDFAALGQAEGAEDWAVVSEH